MRPRPMSRLSPIFHLLYRFSPEIRTEFGRSDEHRWIQRYGFEEITIGKPDDDAVEDGRNSRRRKYRKVVRERPGLVPSAHLRSRLSGDTLPGASVEQASGPFSEHILEHLLIQTGVCHQLLQLTVSSSRTLSRLTSATPIPWNFFFHR